MAAFRVDSGDDDGLGFVFGYQDIGQFYRFDWWDAGYARPNPLMSVRVVDAGASDPFPDFVNSFTLGSEPRSASAGCSTDSRPSSTVCEGTQHSMMTGEPALCNGTKRESGGGSSPDGILRLQRRAWQCQRRAA